MQHLTCDEHETRTIRLERNSAGNWNNFAATHCWILPLTCDTFSIGWKHCRKHWKSKTLKTFRKAFWIRTKDVDVSLQRKYCQDIKNQFFRSQLFFKDSIELWQVVPEVCLMDTLECDTSLIGFDHQLNCKMSSPI